MSDDARRDEIAEEETGALSNMPAVPTQETAKVSDKLPVNGFHLEARCRVCRNDQLREQVNDLLASGASYASIARTLEDDNARLDKRDRITIDSIQNHSRRHFPVQNAAQATYRDILESRAKQNGIDFVDGVATALTPMALYETVMVKGYHNLVEPGTVVDVNTAMTAAARLQSLIESQSDQPDVADMMVKVHRIIDAVKSMLPEQRWPELLERLDEVAEANESLDKESGDLHDDDEAFDPSDLVFDDDADDY